MNESQSDMQLREAEKGEKGEMAPQRPSAARALGLIGVVPVKYPRGAAWDTIRKRWRAAPPAVL